MKEFTLCFSFTVPVLWDKKLNTVVNNESSEIIRMFNSGFNELLPADKAKLDLYPEPHRAEIDALNEWVYSDINSASYACRFIIADT
jgi:putative glutathione S-transferase